MAGNPKMSLIKLFPGRLLHIRFFSPDQERKIPGNPEIPEEFQDRKSLISDISCRIFGW
jgi:hypothetical protein